MNILRPVLPIIAIASAFTLSSCSQDNTILYNDIALGDIVSGRFVSDAGLTYTPVEQNCEGRLDTMGRAVIRCDILKRVSPSEYEVRLNEMSKVLKKDCLIKDEVEDLEALGGDPALISKAWISGGYLNLATQITFITGSKKTHTLNLVYDNSVSSSDTLHFHLLHNSYKECYPTRKMIDDGDYPTGAEYSAGIAYASFPIMTFLPEGKESVPIKVHYTWYVSSEGKLTPDTYQAYVQGFIVR